ncbi:hypothetical protein DENIS_4182 [Desulfonema ishimotonii]|uniref:SH3b domain-containing protein n=1 Tax=Desulfonema ishimotonii TaxID=45657 RepID=A0A401G1U5_9BACT|nr:TIGR04211 family SH3 domain-containing protein [Desulfonema ishimotonii]GBC63189.1 hypothetical protein DENIS_4182 [Desulfonema ishimotonii]
MKWLTAIGTGLILWASVVQAGTMYVNDVIKITMRRGAGISHKVIGMLQSGQSVEVLDNSGDWTRIRLPDGKEGWALTRFLTPKQPNELQLTALRAKHEKLTAELAVLKTENKKLRSDNRQFSGASDESRKALDELTQSYETLRTESQDYLNVKAAYEQAATQLSEQQQRADELAERLNKLEWNRNLMWFISGAGVFLIGFVMGGVNERGKRRRSSYL